MRTIHVKIIREDRNFVTIKLPVANSRMRVPKKDFKERLKRGVYSLTRADLK